MSASKIAALAALAALAACEGAPPPGRPAPTGITSSRGGGTQVVDPLNNAGATAGRGLPNPAPSAR